MHKSRTLLFWQRLSHLIWVLSFLDDWANAGISRKDISSTVMMAPKSRTLFKYLNIKRSSLDHKAHFPILSTSCFFFFCQPQLKVLVVSIYDIILCVSSNPKVLFFFMFPFIFSLISLQSYIFIACKALW